MCVWGGYTPFSFHLFSLRGDGISVPTGQTDNREQSCGLSAAGDRKKNTQPFVPRVTQGYRTLCVCV